MPVDVVVNVDGGGVGVEDDVLREAGGLPGAGDADGGAEGCVLGEGDGVDGGDGACRSRFCSPLHPASLWRRQQLSELVVALGRAMLHAGFDDRVANLLRLIPHRDCEE